MTEIRGTGNQLKKIIEYIDLLRKLPFISLINGSLCVIVLCGIDKFGTFFKK
jgi:hypothetical protein